MMLLPYSFTRHMWYDCFLCLPCPAGIPPCQGGECSTIILRCNKSCEYLRVGLSLK